MADSAVVPQSSSCEGTDLSICTEGAGGDHKGGSLPCTAAAVGGPNCPDSSPLCQGVRAWEDVHFQRALPAACVQTPACWLSMGLVWWQRRAWGEHGRWVKGHNWVTLSDAGERAGETGCISAWVIIAGGWWREDSDTFFPTRPDGEPGIAVFSTQTTFKDNWANWV